MARVRSSRPTIFFMSHLNRDCLPSTSAALRTAPTHSNCDGRLRAGCRSTASVLGWARKMDTGTAMASSAPPIILFTELLNTDITAFWPELKNIERAGQPNPDPVEHSAVQTGSQRIGLQQVAAVSGIQSKLAKRIAYVDV